jgi:hypothetical protein
MNRTIALPESAVIMSPVITSSYTLVKPKVYGIVLLPTVLEGATRSIPTQIGTPVVFPSISPSGKEHPYEGSVSTDEGKPIRTAKNDPTLGKEHPDVS